MAVQGVFASDVGILAGRDCDPVAEVMLEQGQLNGVPLYALTSGMQAEVITQTMIQWYVDAPIRWSRLITDVCGDALGASFMIDDPTIITCKDILVVCETGEVMMVMAVDGCRVTVRRGVGNTPKCALEPNYTIERLSSAFEEGSDPPIGIAYANAQMLTNLTHIVRTTAEATGTAMAVRNSKGQGNWDKLKQQAIIRHAHDKEMAILFSAREIGVIGGRPFRMMAGLDSQIKQRFVCPPTGLDRHVLDAFLMTAFRHQVQGLPQERIFVGSVAAVSALSNLGEIMTPVQVNVTGRTGQSFGFSYTRYMSLYGEVKIFHSDKLTGRCFGNRLYALHPGTMKLYYMNGRQNVTQGDAMSQSGNGSSNNFRDTHMEVLTSEFSMALLAPTTSAVLTDIVPCYR